jgi:hypothetical protein
MLKKPTAIALTVLTLSLTGAALTAELAEASASGHTLRFYLGGDRAEGSAEEPLRRPDKDVESGKTVGFDLVNGVASSKSASLTSSSRKGTSCP